MRRLLLTGGGDAAKNGGREEGGHFPARPRYICYSRCPQLVPTAFADLQPHRTPPRLCSRPCEMQVHVDLEKGLATVTVEAGSQAEAAQPLAEAVKELGFGAEPQAASAA